MSISDNTPESLKGWNVSRLSENVWCAVEADPWGQIPFVYIIVGVDKIVVIDTGTGKHNIKQLIDDFINKDSLPYLILLTHIHFDHIGGVKYFNDSDNLIDVCLSSANKTFSQNYETTCLCSAHKDAKVVDFKVTRDLEDGDIIYLDDSDKENELKQIHVIFTPGHTPDSVSYWYKGDNRLFVGDTIYPFTTIHVDVIGSNFMDYIQSLLKLKDFCHSVSSTIEVDNSKIEEPNVQIPNVSENSEQTKIITKTDNEPASEYDFLINEFCNTLGLNKKNIQQVFNPISLLEICDFDLMNAVDFYLTNVENIHQLFPPKEGASKLSEEDEIGIFDDKIPEKNNNLVLSCGHVSNQLNMNAIDELLILIEQIQMQEILPGKIEQGYAEYSNGTFSIIIPYAQN